MAGYRPTIPFNVAMKLLVPSYSKVQGVAGKTFSEPEDSALFFGSFRTFGGSESMRNELYTIIDTATIDTWYNPLIKADCRIYICDTAQTYEIISEPEDISLRHQYMQFKVRKVGGRA